MQIASLLANYEKIHSPKPKRGINERNQLVKEIYQIYSCPQEQIRRRTENWKRYCRFCREQGQSNCVSTQKKFKQSRLFLKEVKDKNLAYLLSHIPTKDLYYIKSIMQDKINRSEFASMWLFSSLSIKSFENLLLKN